MRTNTILATITLLLILSSCAPDRVAKNYGAVEDLTPDYCNAQNDTLDRDDCFSALGQRLGDAETCKQIGETRTRGNCIYGVAKITQDEKLCESIPVYSLKTRCFNEFS